MKMGRRLRCSSVTYRSRYCFLPSRLADGPFLIATKYLLFRGQDTRFPVPPMRQHRQQPFEDLERIIEFDFLLRAHGRRRP